MAGVPLCGLEEGGIVLQRVVIRRKKAPRLLLKRE